VIAADPHKSGLFAHPRFLPDGKHFLFYLLDKSNNPALSGTYFASLDGRDKHLVYGKTSAIYAAGFLLYLRQGALMAEAFDPEQGRLKDGPPHRVADGVTLNYYHNNFDASESGMLVYRLSGEANEKRLAWFDRTGKNLGVTGEAADYWDVRLSPDGQKLASNSGSPNSEIWVDDLARAVRMQRPVCARPVRPDRSLPTRAPP
jgi:dipeptidyl aminopeptidase/acylaminoacyl peptidase